jgi:hypothetical protein
MLKNAANSANIEEEARIKKNAWFRLANLWRTIDYCLVIAAFISSMVVVYVEVLSFTTASAKANIIVIASVAAAAFTMISFAIEPKKHMRNYRRAFIYLYTAQIENSCKQKQRLLTIRNALCKGEETISNSYDVDPVEIAFYAAAKTISSNEIVH